MLLNAVIIILREVLEISLLITLMVSLSHSLKLPLSWLIWSIVSGLFGSFLYAYNIVRISAWFEGVGQEVLNASLQYLIYLLLAGFCIGLVNKTSVTTVSLTLISWVMALCVSLSISREFSEIIIYLQVFSADEQGFKSVMMGAFLGAGIGLSLSVIFYYALDYLSRHRSHTIILFIFAFLAAGMLLQATQLLIQADWLPAQHPVWDSSAWIAEQSVLGQLLYAVFGYEATPSLLEVVIYIIGLFIILFFIMRRFLTKSSLNLTRTS
jgi:high-affinity iron transporter